jgi:hypothetical protein
MDIFKILCHTDESLIKKLMKYFIFLIFINSLYANEYCNELTQKYIDSKRFISKSCRSNSDCQLVELNLNLCTPFVSVNSKLIKSDLKHFEDKRDITRAACKLRRKDCIVKENKALCHEKVCSSLNQQYQMNTPFNIFIQLEGKSLPPSDVILRREQIVYCITTPCLPKTTDVKIKLKEGSMEITDATIPYSSNLNDISYYLIKKNYEKFRLTRESLLKLKNLHIKLNIKKDQK